MLRLRMHSNFTSCKVSVTFSVFLKMKKDYLAEGSMADTADLVVLGAYYGTGNKGKFCFYSKRQ